VGPYLVSVTQASSPLLPRQEALLRQHLKTDGEALVDFINDMWVVTPVDKERAARRTPHRRIFASKVASKYLLKKLS